MNEQKKSPQHLGVPYQRLSDEADHLAPRPSILLPHLQESEKKFFELVASGDVLAVKDYLEKIPNFNINCVNFQGVSALKVAVQNHMEPMVEFLLTRPGIDIGDCILHAVKDNQVKILQALLQKITEIAPSLEFVGVTHSTDFPDYVTPLILAAQCGHYEIIELLIQRGHTISKPHPPSCRCADCRVHLERDDLLHAESLRLNLYRAVCNPAYICHSTHDPILVAFHLSQELKECSSLVSEFRAAYHELSTEISSFAVDLIACCRSTSEMEVILKQSAGMSSRIIYSLPRLALAMDYKQKTFVAHPNTQQIVEATWSGDWHEYKLKSPLVSYLLPVLRIFVLPVIALMCLALPNHTLTKHWSIPLNKMISHIASYSVFLLLIFLQSNMDKTGQKRQPPNSGLEIPIMLFVAGHIWASLRMLLLIGPVSYFKKLWNWHAVINNLMFLLTFLFWLASYFDAQHNDQVDLERKYWHSLDPILIAEGTFAVAVIMAYFKLLFFCRLNYYVGPLQISLGKMCADMAKYFTIFSIIIISFTAGLCRFYQYYDGMVQVDENDMKTQQVSSFVDFSSTLKTFFWAILCMSSLESADVIIENLPGDTPKTTIINKHDFTEAVGYICFALFEVLIVIMILNMLIATMSSTFQRVLDNLDVEWTYGKTDFYLEYMLHTTLPSPLNLIPTPSGVTMFMETMNGTRSAGNTEVSGGCCQRGNSQQPKVKSEPAIEYPALMSLLVQRYFREKDEANQAASELDVLRQEIHELKALLNDIIAEKEE
ncbi:short transient receptor potential channel 5-like [Anthonomus grandis grandis]|uniref:short transient receptor potential channel 5-like n=1 Tax=Anthonomus grandis grandis TaxID=2921223 RepID=UPI0021655B3D|nr:short transient receptor potential channel 5-like [Anthonomus grandis grandis]